MRTHDPVVLLTRNLSHRVAKTDVDAPEYLRRGMPQRGVAVVGVPGAGRLIHADGLREPFPEQSRVGAPGRDRDDMQTTRSHQGAPDVEHPRNALRPLE